MSVCLIILMLPKKNNKQSQFSIIFLLNVPCLYLVLYLEFYEFSKDYKKIPFNSYGIFAIKYISHVYSHLFEYIYDSIELSREYKLTILSFLVNLNFISSVV